MQDRFEEEQAMIRQWQEDQEVRMIEERMGQTVTKAEIKAYKAELKRRRKIGKTIDPATAETMFWYADLGDPYGILHSGFHEDCVGREHFARNPGGEWVHFNDLPAKTAKALWKRDKRKLVFPYGVLHDYDIVNKPPHTAEA